jgi:ribosomal protein L28/ribosomal protein L31
MYGHTVSHSARKNKRRFEPNIRVVRFLSVVTGETYKMKVNARCIRSVEKQGGFDEYIVKAQSDILSDKAKMIKSKILNVKANKVSSVDLKSDEILIAEKAARLEGRIAKADKISMNKNIKKSDEILIAEKAAREAHRTVKRNKKIAILISKKKTIANIALEKAARLATKCENMEAKKVNKAAARIGIHPEYKKLRIMIGEDIFETYSTLDSGEILMDVDYRKHPAWTKDNTKTANQSNKNINAFNKKFSGLNFGTSQ